MDPYLEDPFLWPGFHARLITYLADKINERLPEAFAAMVEERLYVVQDERDLVADFAVVRQPVERKAPSQGNVTTLAPSDLQPDPAHVLLLEPVEVRERFIEIVTLHARREVVTVIELLSPTNKSGVGRTRYVRKQRSVLRSDAHLLEIDLLRGGTHTVAAPIARLRREADWDYLICLSRATRRERIEYWPVTLRENLPTVAVPLTGVLPDVVLDLQDAVTHVYARGLFDRLIDYTVPPVPPLRPDDASWADQLLGDRGLR
jgi:hypothetical protein